MKIRCNSVKNPIGGNRPRVIIGDMRLGRFPHACQARGIGQEIDKRARDVLNIGTNQPAGKTIDYCLGKSEAIRNNAGHGARLGLENNDAKGFEVAQHDEYRGFAIVTQQTLISTGIVFAYHADHLYARLVHRRVAADNDEFRLGQLCAHPPKGLQQGGSPFSLKITPYKKNRLRIVRAMGKGRLSEIGTSATNHHLPGMDSVVFTHRLRAPLRQGKDADASIENILLFSPAVPDNMPGKMTECPGMAPENLVNRGIQEAIGVHVKFRIKHGAYEKASVVPWIGSGDRPGAARVVAIGEGRPQVPFGPTETVYLSLKTLEQRWTCERVGPTQRICRMVNGADGVKPMQQMMGDAGKSAHFSWVAHAKDEQADAADGIVYHSEPGTF